MIEKIKSYFNADIDEKIVSIEDRLSEMNSEISSTDEFAEGLVGQIIELRKRIIVLEKRSSLCGAQMRMDKPKLGRPKKLMSKTKKKAK